MPYRKVTWLEQVWYLLKFKVVGDKNTATCTYKSSKKKEEECTE